MESTHQGRLDPEARERRRAKNSRNHSRRGKATRAPGSHKRSFATRSPGKRQ